MLSWKWDCSVSGRSLQEIDEASLDLLIDLLAYSEAPKGFRTRFEVQRLTDGGQNSELQWMLRMARHQNTANSFADTLQIEVFSKSKSGWTVYKVRSLK